MEMLKIKTKREFSAGGVLYKKINKEIEIALAKRITEKGREVWCLPKGKVEKQENPKETALREVQEETGMKGEIVADLGSINYWFFSKKENIRIFKTVKFYLMKYTEGKIEDHDWEMEEVNWVKIEDAIDLLSYKTEKEAVTKAKNFLK
jgi:8-oxo-dGTP diphosphatase